MDVNPLQAELDPICHLLTLLGAHSIFHVGRIKVKKRGSVVNKRTPPCSQHVYKFASKKQN